MLDKLLDGLSIFDWISPAAAAIQDLANGPSSTLFVPVGGGRTGGEIAGLLQGRGIETWGHMTVNGYYMLTVRKAQEPYARQILSQAGILEGVTPATPTPTRQPQPGRLQGQSRLWALLKRGDHEA